MTWKHNDTLWRNESIQQVWPPINQIILSKRDISHVIASMRARRRGEIPSGFSPSPAQPCACLSVPAGSQGSEHRSFSRGIRVSFKTRCIVPGDQYDLRTVARASMPTMCVFPMSAGRSRQLHRVAAHMRCMIDNKDALLASLQRPVTPVPYRQACTVGAL